MMRAQSQQPLSPTASLPANNIQNDGDVSANADANKESVPDIDPTISQETEKVKKCLKATVHITVKGSGHRIYALKSEGLKNKRIGRYVRAVR